MKYVAELEAVAGLEAVPELPTVAELETVATTTIVDAYAPDHHSRSICWLFEPSNKMEVPSSWRDMYAPRFVRVNSRKGSLRLQINWNYGWGHDHN
jgi:hypothetical protein